MAFQATLVLRCQLRVSSAISLEELVPLLLCNFGSSVHLQYICRNYKGLKDPKIATIYHNTGTK